MLCSRISKSLNNVGVSLSNLLGIWVTLINLPYLRVGLTDRSVTYSHSQDKLVLSAVWECLTTLLAYHGFI